MKTINLIAIIVVVVAISSCDKLFKNKKVPLNSSDTLLTQVTVPVDTIDEDTIPFEEIVEEIEPVDPQPTGPSYGYTSDKYYMIVGSFFSEQLAHKYATKMYEMGYTPVIIHSNNQFYRVSAQSYNDYNTAVGDISSFRNNVSPRAWVHVKRN
jgi:hypothetical protein